LCPAPTPVRSWPISEVATPFIEVRLVGWSGLTLPALSSSHFDPDLTLTLAQKEHPVL